MSIDQSSRLGAARELRDAYQTEHEREAFEDGYGHAHGIACHCVPRIGREYFTEFSGRVVAEDVSEAREVHAILCHAAEEGARCYTPWEHIAARINGLGEWQSVAAWDAYEAGVSAAIEHDLEGYSEADYATEEDA